MGNEIKNNELINNPIIDKAEIRKRAEAKVDKRKYNSLENIEQLTLEEIQSLLHDLNVHQIELEMQNEELRTVQSDLEASQERYMNLFDFAPVGYCILDDKGIIQEANATATTLFGLSKESLVNQKLSNFIFSGDQDIFYFHQKQLYETREPQKCELRIENSEGKRLWVKIESIYINEDGRISYRLALSNICKRKKIEQALMESEARFHESARQSRTIVWETDKDGIYTYISSAVEDVLGYQVEEVVGKKYIYDLRFEQCEKGFKDAVLDAFQQNEAFDNLENCGLPKNSDKVIWLNTNGFPIFDDEGLFYGYRGSDTDITVRKLVDIALNDAKEKLKQYSCDLECQVEEKTVKLQNEQAELIKTLEQLQMTQDQLILSGKMAALGHLIAGIAHEINSPLGAILSIKKSISNSINSFVSNMPEFCKLMNGENGPLIYQLIDDCLRNQNDNIPISSKERRKLQGNTTEILENNEIENASELARTLVDLKVHNLAEKYVELLKAPDNVNTIEQIRNLFAIFSSCNVIDVATCKISNIVNALRIYSFSDEESLQKKHEVNLKDSLETVLIILHNKLKHDIELDIQYISESLPVVFAIPNQLSQIWTNLILNSIHAMNYQGQLRIVVDNVNDGYSVSVEDTGKGMDNETLNRVFEPFFTTKQPGEGTGLGMDIVKKIIENHNGTIDIESTVGKGTKVTVWIPGHE